ncbi:hypothetical protein OSTOST_04593 [Ostertagia ostertagi]
MLTVSTTEPPSSTSRTSNYGSRLDSLRCYSCGSPAPTLELRLLKLVGLIKGVGEKITFSVQFELTFARREHRSKRGTELRIATSSTTAGLPHPQEARFDLPGTSVPHSRRAAEDTSCKSVITEQARERFDTLAAGVPLSNAERSSLLRELPLVASLFGEVPAIDEQLPRDSDRAILVREPELRTLHETLLNVLNIVELVRKLGADGQGGTFAAPVIGYFEILDTLVSGSLMDLIVLRRERFLKALGVEPRRAMPSYRRLPLAGSTMVHRMRQTLIPDLFGKELRDELAAGDSAITKSLQKLRASAKKRKATPPRQIRNRWAYSYPFLPRSLPLGVSDTILDSHGAQGSSEATIKDPYMYSNRIAGSHGKASQETPSFWNPSKDIESPSGDANRAWPSPSLSNDNQSPFRGARFAQREGSDRKGPHKHEGLGVFTFRDPQEGWFNKAHNHLKPLNAFLEIPHFKMENLHSVSDVAYKGDFLAKIDMRDAYFAVNIAADHRNYLAFLVEPKPLQIHLPTFWASNGTLCVHQINASSRGPLPGARNKSNSTTWTIGLSHIAYAIQIFEHLGLCINHAKSQLVPTQELEFLGLIIDARLGEFRIPPKKLDRIRSEASALLRRKRIEAARLRPSWTLCYRLWHRIIPRYMTGLQVR